MVQAFQGFLFPSTSTKEHARSHVAFSFSHDELGLVGFVLHSPECAGSFAAGERRTRLNESPNPLSSIQDHP